MRVMIVGLFQGASNITGSIKVPSKVKISLHGFNTLKSVGTIIIITD